MKRNGATAGAAELRNAAARRWQPIGLGGHRTTGYLGGANKTGIVVISKGAWHGIGVDGDGDAAGEPHAVVVILLATVPVVVAGGPWTTHAAERDGAGRRR